MNPTNPSDPYSNESTIGSEGDHGLSLDEYDALLEGHEESIDGFMDSTDADRGPLVGGGQGRPDYNPEPTWSNPCGWVVGGVMVWGAAWCVAKAIQFFNATDYAIIAILILQLVAAYLYWKWNFSNQKFIFWSKAGFLGWACPLILSGVCLWIIKTLSSGGAG